jgi:hypothetical protein
MNPRQMDLFAPESLDATLEIKRQIRLVLGASPLSRDQIADKMNELTAKEGGSRTISRATLDSWVKDSNPDRMPGLFWLTILCRVLGTVAPFVAAVRPLGARVVGFQEILKLTWAEAELEKKRVSRRARLALESIEAE